MKIFRTVLCTVLTVILTVILALSLLLTAVTASVRLTFTPEAVVETVEEINFATLVLPDGYGGFCTLLQSVNDTIGYYGMELNESDFNELIRMLSIDDILTVFLQDFRTWLLAYGPVPNPDPHEMASLAISGVDRQLLALLGMFADPEDTVAAFLSRMLDVADLGNRLEGLELARLMLSEGTLAFEASVCLLMICLLLLLHRLKAAPSVTAISLASVAAGSAMLFAPAILRVPKNRLLTALAMPEATFDIAYAPLMETVRGFGAGIAMVSLTVLIFTLVLWIFTAMIRRERERTLRRRMEREYPPYTENL